MGQIRRLMTEVLLEVTTEEIRIVATEAFQIAKGKYLILSYFIKRHGLLWQIICNSIIVKVDCVISKSCISCLCIDYSQESASAAFPAFENIDQQTW